MDNVEINRVKTEASRQVKNILDQLENDYPGITEGLAAALGSSAGAAGSLGALYLLGYTGLSAAGISSGLATAGALVGGGMVAGIGVLAAPIALLGVGGYALMKKRKNAKLAASLGEAIAKLYNIQERLLSNAETFKAEIAMIKQTIEMLTRKKPS
ncbi:hypothetical protein HB13667_25165 [Pseudomonas putida]|jgi:hypothetical protein|uniref:Uncharacterized protein n=2 Tax=Pseudomonas TaxID=286 RepID=A0A0N8HDT3_PSEPU|nr:MULTISPECIES: hypothetical protein [Pseudomonas]TXG96647.1 MAG: hypothetical protein E6R08_08935 [Nevskiaceae bacterium]KPM59452.1 hypothetical protein HB13667_25165 [Pseudomonas putida]KYC19538.1 hypothetical protein WM94_18045 [Pseudomonas sp. ABFPK]MCO7522960.1 hypothetical protein [Pseudomonas asiatica]MCO7535428.1 hypothetical protein [Pseudomonas asiatica]